MFDANTGGLAQEVGVEKGEVSMTAGANKLVISCADDRRHDERLNALLIGQLRCQSGVGGERHVLPHLR